MGDYVDLCRIGQMMGYVESDPKLFGFTSKLSDFGAGSGIRTHEPLRDGMSDRVALLATLSPAWLASLHYPRNR